MKAPFLNKIFLSNNIKYNKSEYPFNIDYIKNGNLNLIIKKPVVIIVGDNGTGKTTLLKAISQHCGFNIYGGNQDHFYESEKAVSYPETLAIQKLNSILTYSWNIKVNSGFFMRADSFIHFQNYLDNLAEELKGMYSKEDIYGYYGGKSLNEQSHGESFLSLFSNRFDKKGIYVLDEPDAALSPNKLLTFMSIIKNLTDTGNAQFIISTHSPILMSYPYAQFLYISNGNITETTYEESEHYKTTVDFLKNKEKYFKYLFE